MTLAHVGVGVLVAGVTASSAWQSEAILIMKPGDTAPARRLRVHARRHRRPPGPELRRPARDLRGQPRRRPVAVLAPEKRFYPVERQPTSEAGIDSGWLRDLYVVLGDPAEGQAGAGIPCASTTTRWWYGSGAAW